MDGTGTNLKYVGVGPRQTEPAWAPKAGGGGRVPSREISGGGSPRNKDISETFFLKLIKFLRFLTFSKQSGRNPRRN